MIIGTAMAKCSGLMEESIKDSGPTEFKMQRKYQQNVFKDIVEAIA